MIGWLMVIVCDWLVGGGYLKLVGWWWLFVIGKLLVN